MSARRRKVVVASVSARWLAEAQDPLFGRCEHPHKAARHWECERSKSNGHFSTGCSQGKVWLPSPPQPDTEYRYLLEGSDSEAKAFRENARSYNNALSFTSLATHFDQTRLGTLGPPLFRVFGRLYHRLGALIPAVNQCPAFAQTWLIDPAEANDFRPGPNGAHSRIQRSTLTKLESMSRTGNRFVREFASAKAPYYLAETDAATVRNMDSSLAKVDLCMRLSAPLAVGSKSSVGCLGRVDQPCLSKCWALDDGSDQGAKWMVKATKHARHGGS
ncbi:BQ5605_C027g10343 [Microbotryum silenes-dioicae]|uniref:BQ5605_C027g10343 protein n=1 Tax=Microbotryum silenes-dioicae TaxID=796604 RepID=A0A2X0PNB4_9BASI|nr:BQ5605_C027g10343 [Microbotryum silenes-dioicae]